MKPTSEPQLRRIRKLRRTFRPAGIDGMLVTSAANCRYLSGFTGDDSALLISADQAFLLTDGRYTEQAGRETRGFEILERRRGLMELAGRTARRLNVARLGFESHLLSVAQHEELARHSGRIELRGQSRTIERLRQTKDAAEIRNVERAIRVAEEAFLRIRPEVRPGRTERELAHRLDAAMWDLGAEGPSFPTIVAAGERSSLPHAKPTDRKVRAGDAVLFDWGARVDSYCSDLTRVLFVDRISPVFEKIYGIVLDAQRRALRKVKTGLTADRIDRAARDCIRSRRHGKHFGHGLGHGLGLEIHELPVVNGRSKTVLEPGMIFTVEPGIYLPGRGGVRIEDDVLVTRGGSRVLTSVPKSLRDTVVRT